MIEKSQRPLIDRPRYVFKPPNAVDTKPSNKPVNKENLNKQRPHRKVINKQMQQPVSGSVNPIDEAVKGKPPVEPKSFQKRKTKKPPMPPRKPKASKEEKKEAPKEVKEVKKDNGLFKQMKDKFVGKSKDEGGN